MAKHPDYRIENVQPILRVGDMSVSRAFYLDVLGFTEDPWGNDSFTCVRKDGGGIYLCTNAQGNPATWLWIGFEGDIYVLYDKLIKSGVVIEMPPGNFSWAQEFRIKDPDGHILRFGTDPDPSLPFLDKPDSD
jgi:catechol 2,3-dioxygenase-like lactoylglutathione lyase family enzyme